MESGQTGVSLQTEPPLIAAHVLFIDVVSYSTLPMDQQLEVKRRLDTLVGSLPEFQLARAQNELVCLPTGDGMALAFFRDWMAPVLCARQIAMALKGEPQFSVRMGLHAGPVYREADINSNLNIVGGGINSAQRVMDLGDGGHILISKGTAETLNQLSAWKGAIHELGQAKVKHGEIVHVFNLFTEDFGNPRKPTKMTPPREELERPNLGHLVSKTCDRHRQEGEFKERILDATERRPGCPLVFFIPGEEGQCHESLVERLQFRLAELSVVSHHSATAAGRVRKIPWHYEDEPMTVVSRLVYTLFEEFGPTQERQRFRPKDTSGRAFGQFLSGSLHSYIAIEHEVHATRWNRSTEEAIVNYLAFWSEIPAQDSPPLVVLFISIVFQRSGDSVWNKMNPIAMMQKMRKKRILSTLSSMERAARIPCHALAELPAVSREDVREWFRLNQIYNSEEQRMRALDRLFQGSASKPKAMWEIERFCSEELRSFLAEGGRS